MKKTIQNKKVTIETILFKPLNKAAELAVKKAVKKFNHFTGMSSQDD